MLNFRLLENLVMLANSVAFFTAVAIGTKMKPAMLANHLMTASKRVFGNPDYCS